MPSRTVKPDISTVVQQLIEMNQDEAAKYGLTAFDKIVKSQSTAPQVLRRVLELEDCLGEVTGELTLHDPHSPAVEKAKLLLKNRLEVEGT